jgi:hypothetical protein
MWGAVLGALGGGAASAYSAITGANAANKAAGQLGRAANSLEARLNKASSDVAGYAQEYNDFMSGLDTNFDPYNVDQAFNSLYEAVIQPMERDFSENVLPSIQAAYSGGVMGATGLQSGAAAEAQNKAQRGLSENKASLRFQERNNAIQRNYAEYDRRANLAQTKFQAQTAAPMLQAQVAPTIFNAQESSIAATLAANQAKAAIPGQILSGAMGGVTGGMGMGNSMQISQILGKMNQ